MTNAITKPGADFLFDKPKELKGFGKVGLICNPTAIRSDFTFLADALIDSEDFEVVALFGPEHGLFSVAQDMVGVGADKYRNVPVYSLYGSTKQSLAPSMNMLSGCDGLIFDIQDIGSRYYTYIWTMTLAMEACSKAKIPFVVCDRPNPIGGEKVEGPMLEMEFSSFVGLYPVCTRHGMTCGEIAQMINAKYDMGCDLRVIRCRGWDRNQYFEKAGLPWVMPSPNMPTVDTAVVYPGGCLIEGTNLSEGRGTTRPFELIGAPFIDKDKLAASLNEYDLPGVYFRPVSFMPTFHKFADKVCRGVFVHVYDREKFRPVEAYLAIIISARNQEPSNFKWRSRVYEFVSDRLAIDLLFGTDKTRLAIENDIPLVQIVDSWKPGIEEFEKSRNRFLLY